MKLSLLIPAALSLFSFTACSQNAVQKEKKAASSLVVGGGCDGCEAIYEQAPSIDKLNAVDTLPDFNEPGTKICISGIVYHLDGKTPAKDVIIYVYHTDQTGHYTAKGGQTGQARRHGYIRGWMKTNDNGQYRFYTLLPASYPNSTALKHIHPVIKEPGKNEYYIDEFIFDDDPFFTPERRKLPRDERGGGGVVKLKNENGILSGERNIYLGKNIPGYPKELTD